MTGGYHGRLLRVDLASGRGESVVLPEAVRRAFLGGVGLGVRLLLDEAPPGVEPLAPEAPLVIALSPLVGSPLTTSAKFAVVAKSPLTGRLTDALASDRFAIELKRAGLDALVVHGAAAAWSVLVIDDGAVHLEPAEDLRGLSSLDAEARLRARHGDAWRFFGIGPAGEHLVRYATISGDGRHAGRGGLGAVLGAKRLKGILVRGTRPTPLADRERVLELAKDLSRRSLGEGTAKYRTLGTIANVLVLNRLGALPTRNFREGAFEGAEAVSGEAFHAAPAPKVRKHCAACTIGCEHVFTKRDGASVRLEYEGIFALGSLCGIDDRETILSGAALCDDLGLDVISAGGTIAFAMECRERGLLPDAPPFGDREGLLDLLARIGRRTDPLGDLLAEGSREAARRIGHGAERFACHVKGLELPGYEPRALQAMALGLAVGARGADHNRSGAYEVDLGPGSDRLQAATTKAPLAARTEDRAALLDSLIVCKFLRGAFDDLEAEAADMLAAVTGWDVTAAELGTTAARIITAKRLFNLREGLLRSEDTLPPRFLEEPLAAGSVAGTRLTRDDLDDMVEAYYAVRGWTSDGQVPRELAHALGLSGPAIDPYLVEGSVPPRSR
jgi:aldehyde:ferredoxin oxidoreductase